MRVLREWIHRLRGTLLQAGATLTWKRNSGCTWRWLQKKRDVVVLSRRMPCAPRGLRPEALRKRWTLSGISEGCRGWTTLRAT